VSSRRENDEGLSRGPLCRHMHLEGAVRNFGTGVHAGDLGGTEGVPQGATAVGLPSSPHFLLPPTAVGLGRTPLTHLTLLIRNINTFSTHQTLHIHRHPQCRCRHRSQVCS
jgi:hypothetical protein